MVWSGNSGRLRFAEGGAEVWTAGNDGNGPGGGECWIGVHTEWATADGGVDQCGETIVRRVQMACLLPCKFPSFEGWTCIWTFWGSGGGLLFGYGPHEGGGGLLSSRFQSTERQSQLRKCEAMNTPLFMTLPNICDPLKSRGNK